MSPSKKKVSTDEEARIIAAVEDVGRQISERSSPKSLGDTLRSKYGANVTPVTPTPKYISPYLRTRMARNSYWSGKNAMGMSPGLLRAREPYRLKNAITGCLIFTFMFGVYSYSINAVKQDDFSDIPMPSEEERRKTISIEEEHQQKLGAKEVIKNVDASLGLAPVAESVSVARFFKGRSAPGALVPRAPPVDNVGTLSPEATVAPAERRWI